MISALIDNVVQAETGRNMGENLVASLFSGPDQANQPAAAQHGSGAGNPGNSKPGGFELARLKSIPLNPHASLADISQSHADKALAVALGRQPDAPTATQRLATHAEPKAAPPIAPSTLPQSGNLKDWMMKTLDRYEKLKQDSA
jgi:hypothetical protein